MECMNTKTLPNVITHLDLIKTIAIILVVIDHIGFYFFPDAMWFRAMGRLGGVPVWFFLIGYANTRNIPNKWLIGAFVLIGLDLVLFQHVFPMNVLVTLGALRLGIDLIMKGMVRSRYLFWLFVVIMVMAYIPTNMVME